MKRHKITLLIGTRPEVIKQAPLAFAAGDSADWSANIVFTGQHRDMGLQMLGDLGLRADRDLALMAPNQTPADFLGVAVPAISRLLRSERPDWVAVQGDTTTALAGALAGFYERVPVVHIEAGLRTYNPWLPFPEEMHRQLVTRVSQAHAAPTALAAKMLENERVEAGRILVSGNTGIDCLLRIAAAQRAAANPPEELTPQLIEATETHRDWHRPLILVTLHRRESIGTTMEGMCSAIAAVARKHSRAFIILPVHLNPLVQEVVHRRLGGISNILLIPPQSYRPFAWLLDRCTLVLTDSGGIQEEAPALGKPVLVLRDVTERPEAVECGAAELVGCEQDAIYAAADRLLSDRGEYARRAVPRFPFGDGRAAIKILEWLRRLPSTIPA